jgi:hypothetical protein
MRGYSLESLLKIANAAAREHVCNIDERGHARREAADKAAEQPPREVGAEDRQGLILGPGAIRPLRDAVAFMGGSIKIYVKEIPRVRIGDCEVGPAKGTEMEVPRALGSTCYAREQPIPGCEPVLQEDN